MFEAFGAAVDLFDEAQGGFKAFENNWEAPIPTGLKVVMEVHALGSKPGMTGPEMARHARRVYERASREVQGLQGGGLPGGSKDGGKRKAGGSASLTGGGAEKKLRSKNDGKNEREMDPNAPTRQTLKSTTEADEILKDFDTNVRPLYETVSDGLGGGVALLDKLGDDSVIVVTLEGFDEMLEELQPSFIIVLDPDVGATRQIEVYRVQNPEIALRVYHVTYCKSVEEQRFLSDVRRETEAFASLIDNKATMVIPETQDGKSGDVIAVLNDAPMPTSTRKGGSGPTRRTRVIVDVREFRSALPSLLHQRGMHVVPVTLQVGDYVLSPGMCVERKSVSDLFSSFASGRLYQQVCSSRT